MSPDEVAVGLQFGPNVGGLVLEVVNVPVEAVRATVLANGAV